MLVWLRTIPYFRISNDIYIEDLVFLCVLCVVPACRSTGKAGLRPLRLKDLPQTSQSSREEREDFRSARALDFLQMHFFFSTLLKFLTIQSLATSTVGEVAEWSDHKVVEISSP